MPANRVCCRGTGLFTDYTGEGLCVIEAGRCTWGGGPGAVNATGGSTFAGVGCLHLHPASMPAVMLQARHECMPSGMQAL
jgi:hypothetical protein